MQGRAGIRSLKAGAAGPHRVWIWLAFGAVLVIAAIVRFYGLSRRELWIDEANSIVIGWENVPGLIERLKLDSSPPLYYLVLHFWMQLLGASDAAVRALSALGGVSLTAAVFLAGRRWFGSPVGLMAATLLACAPTQIFYSQTVRMYAWLPALALLSAAALAEALRTGRPWALALYGVSTLAALLTHNFALHLLPAHLFILVVSGALRRQPGRWLLCLGAIGLGYLPWLPVLLKQLSNRAQYAWFASHWTQVGAGGILWESISSLSPGGTQPPFVRQTEWSPAPWLPVLVVAALLGLAMLRFLRAPRRSVTWYSLGFALALTFIPLVSGMASSIFLTPNLVPGRTDQLVLPGIILLMAAGLQALRPIILRCLVWSGLVAISLIVIGSIYRPAAANSDRALAAALLEHARPGDAVVTTSLTRATLEVYLRRAGARLALLSFPSDTAQHLGNQDDARWLADGEGLEREASRVVASIRQGGGGRRVFAVMALTPVNQPLFERLTGAAARQAEVGKFRQAGMPYPIALALFELAPESGRIDAPR